MIDAVLCELEGVLIDTSTQRRRALQSSLADEGLTLPNSAYDEHCAGLNADAAVDNAMRALGLEDDGALGALLVLTSNRNFARHAERGVMLVPGAWEFIERTRSAARLAAVTRATRQEVGIMLSLAGLDSAFDCVICAEDAPAPKPSPAPYEAALARLARRRAVSRHNAIALEDGLEGIRAATAAGMRCIAVGPLPARRLSGAAATIPSIAGQSPASLDALLTRVEENAA